MSADPSGSGECGVPLTTQPRGASWTTRRSRWNHPNSPSSVVRSAGGDLPADTTTTGVLIVDGNGVTGRHTDNVTDRRGSDFPEVSRYPFKGVWGTLTVERIS